MSFVLQPWQLLVFIVSASMTKIQQVARNITDCDEGL